MTISTFLQFFLLLTNVMSSVYFRTDAIYVRPYAVPQGPRALRAFRFGRARGPARTASIRVSPIFIVAGFVLLLFPISPNRQHNRGMPEAD